MFFKDFLKKKNNRKVLFYRYILRFQGGHLKVWDYYQYLEEMPGFTPGIYFSEETVWDESPWKNNVVPEKKWEPGSADILFVEGVDWARARLEDKPVDSKIPVINLIQHVRHADPADRRYKFLSNKAIRICVSNEVAEALVKTNIVNGPLYTIPNGIDLTLTNKLAADLSSQKVNDVLISGLKNNELAIELEKRLKKENLKVECLLHGIPRENYLKKLATSRVSVLLPNKKEGFYLPALESMAVGTVPVCPDCIGNRSFCEDGVNCFMPGYNETSIFENTMVAVNMDSGTYNKMLEEGKATSSEYSLSRERQSFYQIMNNIDQIWNS